MDQWINLTSEEIALGLGSCSFALVCRHLSRSIPLAIVVIALALWIEWPNLVPDTSLVAASAVLLLTVFILERRQHLPIWLASAMSSTSGRGAEVAVQVATHPVSGKLQVYHLSRWFEAVLIDPANPPLRDGETVYLIRWEARQAWVSRVRSHTPAPQSSKRTHKRWQWSFD